MFRFRKKRNCTVHVADLDLRLVFAYAKCCFSHDAAHILNANIYKDEHRKHKIDKKGTVA